MTNPLVQKLSSFVDLDEEDVSRVESLCYDVRRFKAKRNLIREGDRPEVVFLLLEGWACRYKVLPNGTRHIMAYLLPGDLCDVHVFILKEMDHSLALLSDAKVAVIPKQKMLGLIEQRPKLARALWWATLVDEAILREWLVNMGKRPAYDRVAHLFVELYLRLRAVGLAPDHSFDLLATQADLGDTLGITSVHMNRTLQKLKGEGLIQSAQGRLRIPDIQRLKNVTRFEENYLHLNRRTA
ncbi:Crp/Fnr family transcriptional regulator [Sphingomonas sp.]|uniref:Crp/Fnr family transcriptional regulator n=1 Tax=Sphingomonas sp. TaxID=28214 RepID=UPI003AFF793B